MIEFTALIALGGTVVSLTVTVTLLQIDVLQELSALTKYVVVDAGLTTMLLPVPIYTPPQLPLYHFQAPLRPRAPPITDSVVLEPWQIVEVPVILFTGTAVSLITTVFSIHLVVLHPFPTK
jgi:hypothetical protein